MEKKFSEMVYTSISELDVPLSAAQIQGYFMFYKEDPHLAVKNVHLLKSSQKKIQ